MAVADLIVQNEEGSVADADSYIEVQELLDYFERLGDETFLNESDDVPKICARRATQFFDAVWGPRETGDPTNEDQTTVWPVNGEPFPKKLKTCIFELAKMAVAGPLGGVGAAVNAPSAAQIASMKAGSVEIAFRQGLKASVETDTADRFFMIEKLACTFLKGGGLNTGSSR